MPEILIQAGDEELLGWVNQLRAVSWAELGALVELDRELAAGGGRAPFRVLADEPVHCGHVPLFMPSIGAMEFLRRALPWFDGDQERQTLLSALALMNARDPRELAKFDSRRAIDGLLATFRQNLGVTLPELEHAVEAAMDGFPRVGKLSRKSELGTLAFAAEYLREFGGSLDRWIWQESAQRVLWMGRELEDAKVEDGRMTPGARAAMSAMRLLKHDLMERHGHA